MTPLQLTDNNGFVFTFQELEIPEVITLASSQSVVVHTLIGGKRVIDCMGPVPPAPEWSGEFIGSTALTRARYLQTQCNQATPFTLSWSDYSYSGVISEFHADFMQEMRIPYRIVFTVEEDTTAPINVGMSGTIDDAILGDMDSANLLGGTVNDSALSGLLKTLDSAVSAVSNFAKATTSVINSVMQPLKAVQQRVQILIASSENATRNLTTFGGLVPNNPVAVNAAKIGTSVNTFSQGAALFPLNAVLGRMGSNLGNLAGSSPSPSTKTVQFAGGNLYQIAGQEYGDPTQWNTIAQANGLSDPVLNGVGTLKIPPAPPGTKPQIQPKP